MAAYGKRKKGILSSFAVFQDEKPKQIPHPHQSTYPQTGNVQTAQSITRGRAKVGDESDDEEEGAKTQFSATSHYTATVIRPKSSKSTNTMTEKPALGDKIVNAKSLSIARLIKTDVFGPMTSETAPDVAEALSRPAISGTTTHSTSAPISSKADVDELQKKINNLLTQANIQEEETNRKAKLYAAHSAKISPFQKGRIVFVKATRAIKDRLSSHSNDTPAKLVAHSPRDDHLNYRSEVSSIYEDGERDSRIRLKRRIAEGQNLANPKIQALVGDGNIARKPLPVYESMKSRNQQLESLDDPFSDDDEVKSSPFSSMHATFSINFNKHAHERTLAEDLNAAYGQKNCIPSTPQPHLLTLQPTPRYSNLTSGLAQHPNVMDFSSSPVGFSTPRARLEPQPVKEPKGKVQTLQKSPSLLDFSFEGNSDDEHSLAPSTNSKSVTDGSQSVKRKSAHSDLRSPAPAKKKSKVASCSSSEEMAAGVSLMGTDDERVPLSSQDGNTVPGPTKGVASKSRGLRIFDIGKAKAAEAKCDRENKRPRPRPIIDRSSSLPRSGSTLLSGRDSRPGLKRLTSFGADSMEIDELQIHYATHQVGKKKRG